MVKRRRKQLSRPRKFLKEANSWLLALLVSAALVFFVGEVVVRTYLLRDFSPITDRGFLSLMTILKHSTEPGTGPVILGLGDSYGCVGNENNFFTIFQGKLRASGFPHSLLNVSVPGYQPIDELEMLRRFGLKYHPAIVIQAFFVGNDTDQVPPAGLAQNNAGIEMRLFPFSMWNSQTWALPTLLARTIKFWQGRRVAAFEAGIPLALLFERRPGGRLKHPFSLDEKTYALSLRNQLRHFHKDFASTSDWKKTRDVMSEMIAISRSAGAEYVLLALPDQLQVEDSTQDKVFQGTELKREDYDFQLPQKLLKAYAEEKGVAFLDLYPEFRKEGRAGGLYRFQEIHWSEAGNRLAGRLVSDWFIKNGILHGISDP